MAPSFQPVCFAELRSPWQGNLKTHDHSYWNYFQKHSTHPPALMRDLSSSLGVRFLGSWPHGWFSQPQAVPPGLSFPGLLCCYSPPPLQGVNRAEVLWTSQMKEAGEAEPSYYPLQGLAWEQRLAAFILFQPQGPPPSLCSGGQYWRTQSSSSQCHFKIDFPNKLANRPNHRWPIFSLLYDSIILYRCLNAFFQLATSPLGQWL